MAKGNMLLGQARGKLGDIVFSRQNGEQVERPRVKKINNPQTDAQKIQRIIMNTVAQAYSKMQEICDHSFQGLQSGQPCMSYFMRRNLNLLRQTLSEIGDLEASAPCFLLRGMNGLASNTYIVAKGTLPEVVPQVTSGAVAVAVSGNTYGDVIESLGLQRGDQLTFLTVNGSDASNQTFIFTRVILDPTANDGSALGLETPFIVEGAINAPSPRNEGASHTYNFDDGKIEIGVAFDEINMGGVIVSRQKADGSWLRSNAALILAEDASIGYNMQECLDAFGSVEIDVESAKYLNNALKNARKSGNAQGEENGGNTNPAVAAPTISGNTPFAETTQVTISAESGASIYYTTDGSTPTSASTAYSAPFTLSATATVKAIAVKDASTSTVASKVFTKESGGGDDDENT